MRSLSEVLGSVIVLALVVLAAISIVRVGASVTRYAEIESSALLARDVQMGSPPTMSVVLKNTSLYLLVSSATPINVSYAVVVAVGRVLVERVDAVVSGQRLIDLMPNYSCQNVSIFLVTSTGAVFRYAPWSDPALQGRAPVGADYFSCSFLNRWYVGQPGLYQAPMGLNGAVAVNGTYLVGMTSGLSLTPEGNVTVRLRAYGRLCGPINFTFSAGGESWEGNVTSVGGIAVRPLGSLVVGSDSLTLMGLASCNNLDVGVIALPASGVVNFRARVNVSGLLYGEYSAPPGMLSALALGFTGNFTAVGSENFIGDSFPRGSSYYYYQTYLGDSGASGYGVTPGPIVLASVLDPYGLANATLHLNATLSLTVLGVSGPANASFSASAPIAYTLVIPDLIGSWPVPVKAYLAALQYAPLAYLSLRTDEGDVVRAVGSGSFLIPTSQAGLTVVPPAFVPDNVSVRLVSEGDEWGDAWNAYAAPSPVTYAVIPYMVEVNVSGYELVFVPPLVGDRVLEVGAASEPGPIVMLPLGLNVSGCPSPALAPIKLEGSSAYIRSQWSGLGDGLAAGAYVLECVGGGAYLAIVS